ncbi:MAG: PP2C family protein-serine/threonine phosphatase [Methylovirgula sp.]|uniref:PP2C family protein-serine/threonine phosphatase n=1 Tax=Methylovirgula sp. TaxID=1978224 RepID=UPI003075FD66
MSTSDPLRHIAISLAAILEDGPRKMFLNDLNGSDADALTVLETLGRHLHARNSELLKQIDERTFQLNLALSVLRNRDSHAAEQAGWDFATDLQYSALPQDFPPFPDRHEFDLHAGMVTAKEVGGDLYDFFLLTPTRLGFVIADAAGKGLPAAIFITLTRTLLRAAAEKLEQPGDCLRIVNEMLCIDNPTLMFTTAFYGVLDTETGEVHYANAGHNPPYILRTNGDVNALPRDGAIALGVIEAFKYQTWRMRLNPGDLLVCFTDGVTEAINSAGALYGDLRLIGTLAGSAGQHPSVVLGTAIADVDSYMGLTPMVDDVTLLIVRYNGAKNTTAMGG